MTRHPPHTHPLYPLDHTPGTCWCLTPVLSTPVYKSLDPVVGFSRKPTWGVCGGWRCVRLLLFFPPVPFFSSRVLLPGGAECSWLLFPFIGLAHQLRRRCLSPSTKSAACSVFGEKQHRCAHFTVGGFKWEGVGADAAQGGNPWGTCHPVAAISWSQCGVEVAQVGGRSCPVSNGPRMTHAYLG